MVLCIKDIRAETPSSLPQLNVNDNVSRPGFFGLAPSLRVQFILFFNVIIVFVFFLLFVFFEAV